MASNPAKTAQVVPMSAANDCPSRRHDLYGKPPPRRPTNAPLNSTDTATDVDSVHSYPFTAPQLFHLISALAPILSKRQWMPRLLQPCRFHDVALRFGDLPYIPLGFDFVTGNTEHLAIF